MDSHHWHIPPPRPPGTAPALEGLHPVLGQILYNRGLATAEAISRFLEAKVPHDPDPFQLLDMEKAVERTLAAIRAGERIAIYGDYDADGVTATTLLVQALQALDANVRAYIPNRFDEGYGLNNEALESLKAEGVGLVITVDCGIRSSEEAAHAQSIGLDLIITDHHHPAETLPPAFAVINPKRPGDPYPDKNLAGVGTAYKLACALVARHNPHGFDPAVLLDLVALGTVADLVPLVGENRALVREGLAVIRAARRQGLVSLMGVAGIAPGNITATDIGFGLGPRINAAGRLDSAISAYELLSAKSVLEAGPKAQELDNQNRERQRMTREIQIQAEAMVRQKEGESHLFFVASPDFNPGVVGLTAARLMEKYYRPAIVAFQSESYTRGSCRSIPEFHITNALDACAGLLQHHGGHAAAAGFTVANENLPALVEKLEAIAAEILGGQDLRPVLHAEMEVLLSALTFDLKSQLDLLEPTGYGNLRPAFVSRGLLVKNSVLVGKDKSHLKMLVSDGRMVFDAIAFRQGQWHAKMAPRMDMLYQFEINDYNGRTSLQLNVRDMKPAGQPD